MKVLRERWPANKALVVVAVMFSLAFFVTLGAILAQGSVGVAASGCWRDTPCSGPTAAAFPGSWDKYNYSPASRTVEPVSILSRTGSVLSKFPGTAELKGNGSQLIFDFGQEVAGIATISWSSTGTGSLGMAFTEAKNWTGENSDSSNGSFNPDGALFADITASSLQGNYTMPLAKLRGGFRYLTVFSVASANVTIHVQDLSVEIGIQPDWPNLRAYKGYFYSSDDLLNKIWYSGAYTLQTNAIPPSTGREFPILGSSWMNDQNLNLGTSGATIYVDGSKRDRTVWPGDLGVAVPSILVSTGDWDGVRSTLNVLYADQTSSGELPFAGPGINIYGSDTYHMATLIGTYDYFLWTNDKSWLNTIYNSKFKAAMSFITNKIDSTGMLDVTGTNDWGRLDQGGHNTEANILLYKVLTGGSQIAGWIGDSSTAKSWANMAETLKKAVNANLWDAAAGLYQDSDTSNTVHPQDANALSLLFSVATPNHTSLISSTLTKTWLSIGAPAPELPGNLVGFGQSLEIKAHLTALQPTRALDLIRRAWGWYLNHPDGTASTCIEGYLVDGSFGYRSTTGYDNDASYTSHAHGWGTGPTDALTSWIVGLRVTAPAGAEWVLQPQMGGLSHAEAGFTTPLGGFSAGWSLDQSGEEWDLWWAVPEGSSGTIIVPGGAAGAPSVVLDGGEGQVQGVDFNQSLGMLSFTGSGGRHTAVIKYS